MEVDLSVVEKKPHELTIAYDPDKQVVNLKFDSTEFKTWRFIIGIIEMAKSTAETMEQNAQMMAMQQQMAGMQHARQVIKKGVFQ